MVRVKRGEAQQLAAERGNPQSIVGTRRPPTGLTPGSGRCRNATCIYGKYGSADWKPPQRGVFGPQTGGKQE